MKHLILISVLLAAAFTSAFGSAAQGAAQPEGVSPKRIVILDDIAYRSGPSSAWRLDLAMPENFGEQTRPALVIVHGGGWNAGDKRDRPYRSMLLDYALKGYVTISVNYRLTREAPLPACIEDVKCAVRWLKAHAKEYRVDTSRIAAYGHSAGAHLVLMLGLAGPMQIWKATAAGIITPAASPRLSAARLPRLCPAGTVTRISIRQLRISLRRLCRYF